MSERQSEWVVDRIEGDVVVLVEDGTGTSADVPRSELSSAVSEGDVLRVPNHEDGSPDWASASPDEELRQARLARAQEVLDELKGRDPGGDVVL